MMSRPARLAVATSDIVDVAHGASLTWPAIETTGRQQDLLGAGRTGPDEQA